MGLFYRLFQHLLPDAIAWRPRDAAQPITVGDGHSVGGPGTQVGGLTGRYALWSLLNGLTKSPEDARAAIDDVFGEAFPSTTGELGEWEAQFGLAQGASTLARQQAIAGAWRAQGGQSPRYIQDVLQAAGFPLYVYEWWDGTIAPFVQPQCGEPVAACGEARAQCGAGSFRRFTRNPRDYADDPLFSRVQCGEVGSNCGEELALCSSLLVNDPNYLVNRDLSHEAPPFMPYDELGWRHFIYIGDSPFPLEAFVPAERRAELERLILKIRPASKWVVLNVIYV
jgi:hypothetical protein